MRLLAGYIFIATAAAFLSAPTATAATSRAPSEVSGLAHVIDGDTIHLTLQATGQLVKVRLQGVAAPERSDAGGAEATQYVKQLAEGREARCELDGSRSKDRVVGVCYVSGKDLGAEVIAAGLARDCPRFSGGRYQALEKPAASGLPYPSYCVAKPKASAIPAAPDPLDRLALLGGEDGEMVDILEHGGGLNGCGCHFNRKTGECHCHRSSGCGCACDSPSCPGK